MRTLKLALLGGAWIVFALGGNAFTTQDEKKEEPAGQEKPAQDEPKKEAGKQEDPKPDAEKKEDQDKPAQDPETEPPAKLELPEEESEDFLDITELEVSPRLGAVIYSGDFEADPEFGGGLLLRGPLPSLSKALLGMERDDLWGFVGATVSTLDRDGLTPPLQDPDGTAFFVDAGVEYMFKRDDTLFLSAQLGAQYVNLGGVDGTDDGVGFLAGIAAGLPIGEGCWVTVNPQVSIGSDQIFFIHAGVSIDF